jgi:DNA-directed RNA polymerase specialized sigma24 family protein
MTDQELLQGMRAHDPKAMEAIYVLVRPGLVSYVKQNSGTADEASDVIQDAMVAAYMNAMKPDFELTAALSTYIQGIGRLVWLKHIDRYKKRYIPDNTI